MKILSYLISFLCLLSALTVRAESPYVVESAWHIANNNHLAALAEYCLDKKLNLTLPNEVQSDAPWFGAVITDGKDFRTFISLPLKDTESSSFNHRDSAFKDKLRENAIIAQVFPDTAFFDTVIQEGRLQLISTGLSINDEVDSFLLKDREKVGFGFVQFYPERTLLPTLPLEQENESSFIKKVRARSAKRYQEGKFVGKFASEFWGIQMLPEGLNFIGEWKYADDASDDTESESLPFPFGGFIDADAALSSSFRCTAFQTPDLGFIVKSGIKTIPQEERDEQDKKFSMTMSAAFHPKKKMSAVIESSKENWHILMGDAEDFVTMCYPKQPANRPDEEGVPNNAEMDEINEEFARGILQGANKMGKFLSSQDGSQPFDFACTFDGSTFFLASSNPFTKPLIDGNLADSINRLSQYLHSYIMKMPPREPKNKITPQDITSAQTQGETKSASDVIFHKMDFSLNKTPYAVVYGWDAKCFYLAISGQKSSDNKAEPYERIIDKLDAKITASKRLFAEKMELPKTVLSSQVDGYQVRVTQESDARRLRYTAYIGRQSFSNVMALVKAVSGTSLLPFGM